MSNKIKFNLLNIDEHSKRTSLVDYIAEQLKISATHSIDFMNALDQLLDIHVDVVLLQIDNDAHVNEMLKFLAMLTSDLENSDTPIIIISTIKDNDFLAAAVKDFSVLAIFSYSNWQYQLLTLLKNLLKQVSISTNLENELAQSEDRNTKDPLTVALNRYGAEDSFVHFASRCSAYGENFSLIMLDIDHFKAVNDTYGHDIGDEVIISLSDIIKDNIKSSDRFIRFGGEEFIIMLSNSDLKIAYDFAEKLRLIIQNSLHSTKKLNVTSSFGVVVYDKELTLGDLVKKADLLLYKAKESGRNIVIDKLSEGVGSPEYESIENTIHSNMELIHSNHIFNQYYQAVSFSSILSKTNPQGIITFVNDKFVQLSGYSKEELIGQPQSIVRDPAMSSEVFKELWSTIKAKRMWHGIISNKKKNGNMYIVHAYIFPVLNEQGEIIEFFSIRHILDE